MHIRTLLAIALFTTSALAGDLVTTDHYVRVISNVPAIEGQTTQIYVREIVEPGTVLRGGPLENRVVLFIHGAGTPAEVAFDAPYDGYSWMKHIARAGFDTFSMDMTGYGRSTRPTPMNDPCNLSEAHRAALTPGSAPKLAKPATRAVSLPSSPTGTTSIRSSNTSERFAASTRSVSSAGHSAVRVPEVTQRAIQKK